MSVGALTTTFTPAESCLSSLSNTYAEPGDMGAMYGGPLSTDGCFPDRYAYARTNYYSPGICPDGYTTACSSTIAAKGEGGAVETVVTCCPRNFDCNPSHVFPWETTMGCASRWSNTNTFPTVTMVTRSGIDLIPVSTDSVVQPWGAVNAFSVQIRFQPGDFNKSGHTSTNADTLPSATATVPMPTSSSDSSSASRGLSGGEVAGIAVGSAIGTLLLAATVYYLFLLRRRRQRRQLAPMHQAVDEAARHPSELLGQAPKELPGTDTRAQEMSTDGALVEMPSSARY
ncbi:hypothetical protein B0T10DRAFT_563318 [Thelonectria olida]|uniref:Uncharacterized protein n=1 Tax=Thelonectria olida TaxID=1576542 RepID=A0A9P9AMX8_9HYPO|nr:hypothetical protein B0T10DRAFT_563318 [Thelonectria olida]